MRILWILVPALLSGTLAHAGASLVLRNGAVYTLDPAKPWARAVAVDKDRIVYVGDDEGAQAHVDSRTRVVDLRGRMVLPGFHDAHAHPMSGGMRLLRCRLGGRDAAGVYEAVVACGAADNHEWLIGSGWPRDVFPKTGPARAKLDELVPDRPAFLTTEDGETAWVNSRALEIAGIDARGVPAALEGDLAQRVRRKLPQPSEAEYREALRRATKMANALGITSIFDASAPPALIAAYRAADRAGELTVRIVAAQRVDTAGGPEQAAAMVARRDEARGTRFRAHAAKIFVDGEIGAHTAALLRPYADARETRGDLSVPAAKLDALVRRLDADGFDIHMHVMGDRAARTALDAIERAARSNRARDRRHQLAHLGVVHRADVPRFARLGVAANFTPIWARADDPSMTPTEIALGPERSRAIHPLASLAATGARITAGSDWPSESMSPLDGIQVAVTRQPLDGRHPAKQPHERVALATILAAYTREAAWAAREEALDGSIEVGKAADLVVLERNLFEVDPSVIREVRVLLTLLGGEPVHRAPDFFLP